MKTLYAKAPIKERPVAIMTCFLSQCCPGLRNSVLGGRAADMVYLVFALIPDSLIASIRTN
jgi:hypothetical protein